MARSVVATDNFNRANGGLGANWADLRPAVGTLVISTNQVTAATSGVSRWIGAGTFTDNQYASLILTTVQFGSTARIGVLARASAGTDAARDYYQYFHQDDGDLAVLQKVVDGVETTLDSRASTFAVNDRIDIEVEGTTIRGLKNGTVLVSVTDAALATGTPGAMVKNSSELFGDDWEGGNLTAAAATLMAQGVM